ncbi:MAG: metallophosphoesterase family protein [Nitrospinaceae bacterium]
MRYLIISDLHSNLEALERFVEVAENLQYDRLVCLGDLVGYGANPNEVVTWVRRHADLVLAGNHDYAVVEKTDITYFNDYARRACIWTRQVLTPDHHHFLGSLPLTHVEDDILWTHASPWEPEAWHYVLSRYDGVDNFPHFGESRCFIGHTHRPLVLMEDALKHVQLLTETSLRLEPEHRYLLNVGSLGQPRDGNPHPAFALFDSAAGTFEVRRFSYAVERAQEKILENGLPPFLASRLEHGE